MLAHHSPSSTMKRRLPPSPDCSSETTAQAASPTWSAEPAFGFLSQPMVPSYSEPVPVSHFAAANIFQDSGTARSTHQSPTKPLSHKRSKPRFRRRLSEAGDSVRSAEEYDDRASVSSTASTSTSRSGSISWKSCAPYSPLSTTSSLCTTAQTSFILESPIYSKTPSFPTQLTHTSQHKPPAAVLQQAQDAQPLPPARSTMPSSAPLPVVSITGDFLTRSPESSPETASRHLAHAAASLAGKTASHGKRHLNKKKLSLVVNTTDLSPSAAKSCPLSPADGGALSMLPTRNASGLFMRRQASHESQNVTNNSQLGSTLRGQMSMRRRTSLPKLNLGLAAHAKSSVGPMTAVDPSGSRQRMKGQGDSARLVSRKELDGTQTNMQSDEFPYQNGPVEILPGLYLGSEQNAKDPAVLRALGISSIMNVAKEVECPWIDNANAVIVEEDEDEEILDAQDIPNFAVDAAPFSPPPINQPPVHPRLRSTQTLLIRPTSSTPNLQAVFASASPLQHMPASTLNVPSSTQQPSILASHASFHRHFPANPKTSCPAFEYVKLPWTHDQSDVCHQLPLAVEYIDGIRNSGQKILVHCQLGISRSASLIIGYVMSRYTNSEGNKLGMHDAYAFVKDKSMWISPNIGFVYQLVDWDKRLTGLPISSDDSDADMSDPYTSQRNDVVMAEAATSPRSSVATSDDSSQLATPGGSDPLQHDVDQLSPMASALRIKPLELYTTPMDQLPSPFRLDQPI